MTPLRLIACLILMTSPALAQTTLTECDRLAGYPHTPRLPGFVGVETIADPVPAIAACTADLAAPGADAFLNFLLARAVLSADPDDPRALALIEAGSAASPAFAASRLGLLHDDGLAGLPADDAQALALAEAACARAPDRFAWAGCNNLGLILAAEGASEADASRGIALLEGACDAGFGLSCQNLTGIYAADGLLGDDPAPHFAAAQRACDLGDAYSCGTLADIHRYGRGRDANPGLAATLFRDACDGGDAWACHQRGEMLADGTQIPRDWQAGLAAYARSCELGYVEGCYEHNIGLMHGPGYDGIAPEADKRVAFAAFEGLCAEGHGPSCTEVGFWFVEGGVVPVDMPRALIFHAQGCDLGDLMGCNNQGLQLVQGLGVTADVARGSDLYRHACDAGLGLACENLAAVLADPAFGAPDLDAANALRARACDLGQTSSCAVSTP